MKAARIHRYGKDEKLVIDELDRPAPGPGDLLIAVRAASINPVDFKIRDGALKQLIPFSLPLTLGNDCSGTVAAVGAGVSLFKPGDEVYARLDKDRIGGLAELALVKAGHAALKPQRLSHVEAASIPLVGLTAWQALIELGNLQPGQLALIQAGSGGVGTFAIQLARHLGARVATTCSAKNEALVRELGAEIVVDYRTQQFDEVIRDADLVFDTQGGETLHRSFKCVRRGGTVVTVGGTPDGTFARAWGLNPVLVIALTLLSMRTHRLARRAGAKFHYLFMHPDGAQLTRIGALLQGGILKPVIDRTFPLEQAQEALAYVEAGRSVGKVVVTMSAQ